MQAGHTLPPGWVRGGASLCALLIYQLEGCGQRRGRNMWSPYRGQVLLLHTNPDVDQQFARVIDALTKKWQYAGRWGQLQAVL